MRWLIARTNDAFFALTDPCEFFDGELVDAVTAFEYALTFKRVMRRAVATITDASGIARKSVVFEIAELLETLRRHWVPADANSVFFKRLHHSTNGASLLKAVTCPPNFERPET